MSPIKRLNIVSTAHTGSLVLPFDQDRGYLMIAMTSGTSTVELGDGGGLLPLAELGWYEPTVCPMSKISIETVGTYVILQG